MAQGPSASDPEWPDEPPFVWPPYQDYPAWPKERPRRRRTMRWLVIVAILAVSTLLGPQLVADRTAPDRLDARPADAQSTPNGQGLAPSSLAPMSSAPSPGPPPSASSAERQFKANTRAAGAFTGEFMYRGMNVALIARDHDAFFQYVQGDAIAPLELWWANMTVLGATSGGIDGLQSRVSYSQDTASVRIRLGAVLPFAATRPSDAPHDAGRVMVPFMVYAATVAVYADGAGGRITSWANDDIVAPWDSDPLYAAISDGVMVAGRASEQALVDSTLARAQEATADALAWYRAGIGGAPSGVAGFTLFVTSDDDAFARWMAGPADPPRGAGVAGVTTVAWRWQMGAPDPPGGDHAIAFRGYDLPVITLGPLAVRSPLATRHLIAHEEMHALQISDHPLDVRSPASTAAIEGWARYAEDVISDGGFAVRASDRAALRACVRAWFDGSIPTEEQLRAADAHQADCAYDISASMFAFAAEQGRDVFAAATDTYVGRAATPFPNDAADAGDWGQWLRGR